MEISLNVPTNQEEITVGQYQRWKDLDISNTNDNFLREKIIEIFCNVPHLLVHKMKRRDFLQISASIYSVLEKESEHVTRFKLDGVEYGFIPNLNDITTGEYADLDDYLGDWGNLHKAMAVLYRKVKKKHKTSYNIVDYEGTGGTAEIMKKAPLSVAKGAIVFFYALSKQLLRITPSFLQEKLRETKKTNQMEVVTLLEKNGVGISTYTQLLEETCLKLEMLLELSWGKHSFSLPSTKNTTKQL